jgi:hypothetical protein
MSAADMSLRCGAVQLNAISAHPCRAMIIKHMF